MNQMDVVTDSYMQSMATILVQKAQLAMRVAELTEQVQKLQEQLKNSKGD